TPQKAGKFFRIRSGYREVCTTLLIELKVLGQIDSELVQELLLPGGRLGDAPQANLAAVSRGQNDIRALQRCQFYQRPRGRPLRLLAPQQVLQRDPQRVA